MLFQMPDGYLTSWEAMDRYFEKLYGAERVEVDLQSHWPLNADGVEVPYWTIIGTTGFLHDDWYRCSITTRAEKLREHGFVIEPAVITTKIRNASLWMKLLTVLSFYRSEMPRICRWTLELCDIDAKNLSVI